MKLPEVHYIANLEELIKVFGDPKAFAKWLEGIKATEDSINEKLKLYGKVKKIEARESSSLAALGEAKVRLAEAEAMKADAKKEATEIVAEANSKSGGLMAEVLVKQNAADKAHTESLAEKKALDEREEDVGKREANADALLVKTQAEWGEANALKEKLQLAEKQVEAALKG